MIVDGRAQFVGNRTHESGDQIRWAAAHQKSRLLLTPESATDPHTRTFELRIDPSSAAPYKAPLDLWIALTEKNLSSNVTAGENSGELLYHAPVVRLLRKQQSLTLPSMSPIIVTIHLDEKWKTLNLTAIAFLSDPNSHQIQAAGSSHL